MKYWRILSRPTCLNKIWEIKINFLSSICSELIDIILLEIEVEKKKWLKQK